MKLYDISQPLADATAVWPGDRPFALAWTLRRDAGDSVNVAAISLSVHAGTHADGPLHVRDAAAGVGSLPLEPFLGPARVVDATGRDELGEDAVDGLDLGDAPRILFRTRSRVDPEAFPDRVSAVSPALARRLAAAGVRLVGTDAPSVDPLDSKALDAHRILMDAGIAVLENLVLAAVPPGRYTLVALPLRLAGADSSPVRAVLVDGPLE